MKNKYEFIRVMLFTLFGAGLAVLVYRAFNPIQIGKKQDQYYTLQAQFADVKQLQIGDDVRIAGILIGMVSNMQLRQQRAVVTLRVKKAIQIPADSTANLATAGLLGGNYIAIVPGNAPHLLAPNATIETAPSMDLNHIIKRVDGIANDLSTIFASIKSGEGTLGRLINDQTLANDVAETVASVKQMMANLNATITSFQQSQGVIGKLLSDPKMAQSFEELVENLREFSAKLKDPNSTLGRILTDDGLYQKVEAVLEKVDTAADGLQNAGPVSAVGTAAGALF